MAKTADPLLFNLPSLHHHGNAEINRTKRGMYKLEITPDKKLEEQRKSLSKLSSLSLLKSKNQAPEEEINNEVVGERPVTPINETIRCPPKLFSVLSKHIRRRINPRPHWDHISIEDQRSLGAVLLGEVNAIWPTLRQQVDDPFLTSRQNKELQRRISVHIVAVCEQLFLYHCNQFKTLTKRGIFSTEANMSRTRGQIALDADKYLNVLAVRRHITSDLKKFVEHDTMKATKRSDPITQQLPTTPHHLSFKGLLKSSRPQEKKKPDYNMNVELRDMYAQMPVLDVEKVYSLLPPPPTKNQNYEKDDLFDQEKISHLPDTEYQALSERKIRRWVSEPKLFTQDLFEDSNKKVDYDELESKLTHSIPQSRPLTRVSNVEQVMNASLVTVSAPTSACRCITYKTKEDSNVIDTKQDLIDLLARNKTSNIEDNTVGEDQDIPPLIQAITRREKKTHKMQELRKCEEELNARKKMAEEKENLPFPQPSIPQPSVVQVRLPGHSNPINHENVTIRTCDLQIPEKVDLPTVTLDLHGPLFNDLTGEISAATVKGLDANLFQGEELNEVYTEIMKTVSDLHLNFDNDPMVVKPAGEVNMSEILASSSLDHPRTEQIINPNLTKTGQQPPWGGEPQDLWEKKIHMPSTESVGTALMDETLNKNSRAYASWLAWWKATITTDDYFKYLATQDTDFLGVIFHFYDSEATTSETDSFARSALLVEERKRNERLMEIKAKKEHYVKGLWNANVIALGGLGKYPELEDDNEEGTIVSESLDQPMPNVSPRSSILVPSIASDSSLTKTPNNQQKFIQINSSETTGLQTSSETLETVTDSMTTAYTDNSSIAPSPSGNVRKLRPLGKGLIKEKKEPTTENQSSLSFNDFESGISLSWCTDDHKKLVSTQDENSSGYVSCEQNKSILFPLPKKKRLPWNNNNKRLCAVHGSKMTVLPKKRPRTKPINLLSSYYNMSMSATSKTTQEKSMNLEPEPPTIQSRLEVVWKKLKMSGSQKLDLALKYSSDAYMPVLEESLIAWEKVTEVILEREIYLFNLEVFERDASNPSRFFSKGAKGSSVSRLNEAKVRAKLLKKLSSLEKQISVLLEIVQSVYQDTITYAGRPYQEKMTSDKVEMLYWLQQERRCQMLDEFGQPNELYNFKQNNHTLVRAQHIILPGIPQ